MLYVMFVVIAFLLCYSCFRLFYATYVRIRVEIDVLL